MYYRLKTENQTTNLEFFTPGVPKEKISIKVFKDRLTVSVNESKTDFLLSNKADTDKIESTYKDGLLKITVPLKEEEFKEIQIK